MIKRKKMKEEELLQIVKKLPLTAFILGGLLLIPYFIIFSGGFSFEQVNWGSFGDFFGGVMGVIIGLMTLMVLALAYESQRKELKFTREELRLSREEQANASKALAQQNDIALKRAQISELMEATRHLHAELKVNFNDTKVSTIVKSSKRSISVPSRISLSAIYDKAIKTEQLPLRDTYNYKERELQTFLGMLSQLSVCYLTSLELAKSGNINPLIQSIIYHWLPVVEMLKSMEVQLGDVIQEAFQV